MKSLILSFLLLSLSLFSKEIKLNVSLSPAGSFVAKSSNLMGKVNYKASENRVWANRIKVPVSSFDTGMSLRNEHFAKHLKSKKHPNAILKKFKGKNGKGKAILEIAGAKKKIKNIVYKIKGNNIIAKFKVNTKKLGLKKVKYLGVGVEDVVVIDVEMPVEKK